MKQLFTAFFILVVFQSIACRPKGILHGFDGFVYVPAGSVSIQNKLYSSNAFLMAEHEVTNGEYLAFLNDLRAQNRLDDFNSALPDTLAWNFSSIRMKPYVEYYFRHPVYADFPVVNISEKGAGLYCSWVEQKLKTKYGKKSQISVRLPNEIEWMYAASGGSENSIYSWGNNQLQDEDSNYLANFYGGLCLVKSKGECFSEFTQHEYITDPSVSFKPNAYGLYNMSGNVSELVKKLSMRADLTMIEDGYTAMGGNWNSPADEIQITSKIAYEKANPFVGFRPVYTIISEQKKRM